MNPLRLARRPLRLVEIHRTLRPLDHAQLIVAVDDLELLRQIRLAPVRAQQTVRNAMERPDPHAANGPVHQLLDTCPHLRSGLVRERDGENPFRQRLSRLEIPRDPVHEHARLAAAGARENERLRCGDGHRLALG